jgi:hypothetical protein
MLVICGHLCQTRSKDAIIMIDVGRTSTYNACTYDLIYITISSIMVLSECDPNTSADCSRLSNLAIKFEETSYQNATNKVLKYYNTDKYNVLNSFLRAIISWRSQRTCTISRPNEVISTLCKKDKKQISPLISIRHSFYLHSTIKLAAIRSTATNARPAHATSTAAANATNANTPPAASIPTTNLTTASSYRGTASTSRYNFFI